MALYLTIREGESPEESYPVLATADPTIIDWVVRGLVKRFSKQTPVTAIASLTKGLKVAKPKADDDTQLDLFK